MNLTQTTAGIVALSAIALGGSFLITGDSSGEVLKIEVKTREVHSLSFLPPNTIAYSVSLKEDISEPNPITYEENGGYISFSPTKIQFNTGESIREINNKKEQRSKIKEGTDPRKLIYKDSFGTNFDVVTDVEPDRFKKIVTINAKEDLSVPLDAEYVELYFKIETSYDLKLGVIDEPISLSPLSRINVPVAWDSSNEENAIQIEAEIYMSGEDLFLVKRIPLRWIETATFPILTDVDISFGTDVEVGGISTDGINVESIDTDRFVLCRDVTSATKSLDCYVGSVSGTTITFGSGANIDTDIFGGGSRGYGVCKTDTGKFAVVYPDDADDDGYVRIGTTTGTTINGLTTPFEFNTADAEFPTCDFLEEDKIVVVYNDEGAGDSVNAVVCTMDASDAVSCGVEASIYNGTSINVNRCGATSATVFICTFFNFADSKNYIFAATVSGTTITSGTPFSYHADNISEAKDVVGFNNGTHFVVAFRQPTTASGGVLVGSVSGTTVTLGLATTTFETGTTTDISVTTLDSTHFAVAYADSTETDGSTVVCEADFGTLTSSCNSPDDFTTDVLGGNGTGISLLGNDTVVVGYYSDFSGRAIVGTFTPFESGTTTPPIIPDNFWDDV